MCLVILKRRCVAQNSNTFHLTQVRLKSFVSHALQSCIQLLAFPEKMIHDMNVLEFGKVNTVVPNDHL